MADMRVWVGCLACCNEGSLVGDWVDALEAPDFVPCDEPGHEEWWCFDHEGFHGVLTGEFSPCQAQLVAEACDDLDEKEMEALGLWISHTGSKTVDIESFRDDYRGIYDSVDDYVEQMMEDTGELDDIPPHLRPYFDFEAYGRDMEADGLWTAVDSCGRLHVFYG